MKKGKFLIAVLLGILFLAGCGETVFSEEAWEREQNLLQQAETEKQIRQQTVMQLQKTEEETAEETEGADYAALFQVLQSGYAFGCLTEAERYWYADIYSVLAGQQPQRELQQSRAGILTTGDVDRLFLCVMNDHPELFYVIGYSLEEYTKDGELCRLLFEGSYSMDEEEVSIRREQIALYTGECLAGIAASASDYEKVKYVYEYIIEHTEYRPDAPQNQNICSVFISRESVCQGYAKAMQYLLEQLGVPCTLVLGSVDGIGHAWNLVQVDGEYYYVDSTWGDASYQSRGTENSAVTGVNYDYLCVTTKQLCETHEIANIVEVPECVSMTANYYVMEGAYFETYDEKEIGSFLKKAQKAGETVVTVKCADETVYERLYEEFITNQCVFAYLETESGVIAYADSREQLSLTLWLTEE